MSVTSPHSDWSLRRAPDAPAPASVWKARFDDPFNRYYRYPLARVLVRGLVKTKITPNQVTFVQPFLAAIAGYLVTFADARHLALGALLFEARSVLDCVDGTLARARAKESPAGHAADAAADWISTFFLYAGIGWHFHLHAPPASAVLAYLSTNGVLLLVLLQAALRSFAWDYYKRKYTSIFTTGHDATEEALRRDLRAVRPDAPLFARADVLIGRLGHLFFQHEWLDPERPVSAARRARVAQIHRAEGTPVARWIAFVWSISSGDTFLSLVVLSLLANRLWSAQIFFATAGFAWIAAVVLLNGWYATRGARRVAIA
jgi:phosphatidylglycerophosphate synthase